MDYDFVIIGSGFGGSVSAHRLTEKEYRVEGLYPGIQWHSIKQYHGKRSKFGYHLPYPGRMQYRG